MKNNSRWRIFVAGMLLLNSGGIAAAEARVAKNPPDYKAEMVRWFDLHLRKGQR